MHLIQIITYLFDVVAGEKRVQFEIEGKSPQWRHRSGSSANCLLSLSNFCHRQQKQIYDESKLLASSRNVLLFRLSQRHNI